MLCAVTNWGSLLGRAVRIGIDVLARQGTHVPRSRRPGAPRVRSAPAADRADDPDWVGVGAGAWDREGRPSYVRLDRVLEVGEHDIRREGAVLDRERFDRVADGLRARHGWT